MFGYYLRQLLRVPFVGSPSSPLNQPVVHDINTLVDSIHDVRAMLEYIDHPFILVGNSAACWVQPDSSTSPIIDLLISTSKLDHFVNLLTMVGQWDQPTSMSDVKAAVGRGPVPESKLWKLHRDADVLLQRPQLGDKPSVFLRLWSEDTYHLSIKQQTVTQAHTIQGRVYANPWRSWNYNSNSKTDQKVLRNRHSTVTDTSDGNILMADKVFIPTLPALVDALVYQHLHLSDTKDLLSSDADSLIKRLTGHYNLDVPETGALLLAAVEPATKNYLEPYFEQFERPRTLYVPKRFRVDKIEKPETDVLVKSKADSPVKFEPEEIPLLPSPATSNNSPETMESAKGEKSKPMANSSPRTETLQRQPQPRGIKRESPSSSDDDDAITNTSRVKRARTDCPDDTPSRVKRTKATPSKVKRVFNAPSLAKRATTPPLAQAETAESGPAPLSPLTPGPTPGPKTPEPETELDNKPGSKLEEKPEKELETIMKWHHFRRTRVPLTKGVARPKTPANKRKAAASTKNTKNDRVQKRTASQKKNTGGVAARSSSPSPQEPPSSPSGSASAAPPARAPRPRRSEVRKLFMD
ncbi:hypothetical protein F4810DRAFT_717350 [Camillea tinctor]|nr:hypothetical protein F4810DRAFT_717350 [Camillea tinctor]